MSEGNGSASGDGNGAAPYGYAELLRALSSHTLVGIVMIVDGKFVYANDGVTLLTGTTPEELMARGPGEFFDFIHPDDREMTMDRFVRRFAGEEGLPDQYDLRVLHQDGSVRWASICPEWVNLGESQALVVSFVDITERKAAEEAREASEVRYRNLFDLAPVGIALTTLDGKIFEINDALERFSSWPREQLIGTGYRDFGTLDPEVVSALDELFDRLRRGDTVDPFEIELSSGREEPLSLEIHPSLLGTDKEESYIHFLVRDNTEARVTTRALRRSEERYRNLFDHAPIGIAVLDTEGRILEVNREATEILHMPVDALVGQKLGDYETANVHIVDRLMASIRTLLDKGWAVPFEVEARLPGVDGTPLWFEIYPSLLGEPGESRYVHVMVRDITARRQAEWEKEELEAQLRHRQKLESIGTLAAGVAHEINNPVTGIINFAQVIAKRADPESGLEEFARNIISESWRVSGIVKSLLAFSRQERVLVGSMALKGIVDDTLMLVNAMLREDQISIEVDVPGDLPRINCRGQQIQQVLMNVITNARDAVRERFPDADDRVAEDRSITVTGRAFSKEGRRWARLTVADRGGGIAPEVAGRIFDPFFTTKPPPHGTGLGLAVSYGIVQEHGGDLTFESEPGEGTRFHLDLPASNGGD